MFFIFGMPRSGTTLLAQCLNAHPEIVVPHETDFIIPLAFIFDRINDPNVGRDMLYSLIINSEKYSSLEEYLEPQTIEEVLHSTKYHPSSVLNGLYAKLAETVGAKIAGDKSPNDISFLRMLVKVTGFAPDMKVIHIIRDIRDVMVSVNRTGWVTDLDLYFPRFWCSNNLYLHAIGMQDSEKYALVRYEDLVLEPEKEIGRLTRFLGFDFDKEMLQPEKRHPRYKEMAVHPHLYSSISDRSVGRYHSVLDDETLHRYEVQAQEAMEVFGYTEGSGRQQNGTIRSVLSRIFK